MWEATFDLFCEENELEPVAAAGVPSPRAPTIALRDDVRGTAAYLGGWAVQQESRRFTRLGDAGESRRGMLERLVQPASIPLPLTDTATVVVLARERFGGLTKIRPDATTAFQLAQVQHPPTPHEYRPPPPPAPPASIPPALVPEPPPLHTLFGPSSQGRLHSELTTAHVLRFGNGTYERAVGLVRADAGVRRAFLLLLLPAEHVRKRASEVRPRSFETPERAGGAVQPRVEGGMELPASVGERTAVVVGRHRARDVADEASIHADLAREAFEGEAAGAQTEDDLRW